MSSRLVSVCIPTYNGAQYLAPCLESVLAQTHTELEILAVDDASQDATQDVLKEYAARDSRLRVLLNERNLGLVGNWNRCLEVARGRWIKFLFQDDLIAPDCVGRMLACADQSGMAFVACDRDFIFEPGVGPEVRDGYERHRRFVTGVMRDAPLTAQALAALMLAHMPRNFVGEPTATLFDSQVVQRIGVFNPDLVHLCDAEFWLRAGLAGGIAWVPDVLATFRVHGGSTTAANMSVRQFRAMTIDPMIVRHEYLFAPGYQALRDFAGRSGQDDALRAAYWDALHYCRQGAAALARLGNPRAIQDLDGLAARYPHLAPVPLTEQARRVARKLTAALRPRRIVAD